MRWPLQLYRVHGQSMHPALSQGKILIATGWFRSLRPHDLVVIQHEGIEKVKRLHHVDEDKVFVLGDNSLMSTDSRQFGWLPRQSVVMKVVWPRARQN